MESGSSVCGNQIESGSSACGSQIGSETSECGSQMESGSSACGNQIGSGTSAGKSQMESGSSACGNQIGSGTSVGGSQVKSGSSACGNQIGSGTSVGGSQMESGAGACESQMVSETSVDENSIEDGVSIDRNNGENDVSTDNDDNVGNNPDYNNTYSNTDNYSSVQQIDEPVSVNNNNESTTNQTLEESNFTKEPLLVTGSQETTANESIEDNESILIKIAQKLQEVEKEPAIIKGVNLGIPLTKGKSTQATIVRDDIPQSNEEINAIAEKTAEELERIIARLKADQTINSKIKDIEEELTKLHSQNDESEIVNKSHIEEKIEARYIEKQVDQTMNEEERDMENVEVASKEIFEEDFDTSPRNALNFIKKCIRDFSEKGDKLCKAIKKPLIDSNESIQEEVDYISEIDRKIKEIEERRKQERNHQ